MGTLRIVPMLPKLMTAHSTLVIDLRLEDRVTDLVGEGVDIVVRAGLGVPDTTSLVAQPLGSFERFLVASPAYLRREGTPKSVAALASHAAISSGAGAIVWHFIENDEPASVTVRPKLRVETMLARREAELAGIGVAVLPDFVIDRDLAKGSLRRLFPKATLQRVDAVALYRTESRGTPRVEAVVKHLRATLPLKS